VNPTAATSTSEENTRLARSSNAFAFDLWRRFGSKPGNMAVSPASISLAIAMTYGGAKGETASQMKKALHFDDDPAPLAASWGKLSRDLVQPSRPLKLAIANRLFGDKAYRFEPSYLEQTEANFGAPLEAHDFRGAPEPARQHINGWVEKQTNERIKDLLPPQSIMELTRLVLVNAIYFLADWAAPFSKEHTSSAPFSVTATSKKDVPTMHRMATFPLTRADRVSVLELPYQGGSASMIIVLPDRVDGLADLERSISAEKLAHLGARAVTPECARRVAALRGVSGEQPSPRKGARRARDAHRIRS
jgi:serpin B